MRSTRPPSISRSFQTIGLILLGPIVTARAGNFLRPFAPVSVVGQPPAHTQSQTAPQPTFRTEANYVRVDVYPTMDGSPVADLRRDDFEVVEDSVVQSIDAFEHVIVRVGQDRRGPEPSAVAESRALVENPRARVFVLFLDAYHVSVEGSANIRAPLTRALDLVRSLRYVREERKALLVFSEGWLLSAKRGSGADSSLSDTRTPPRRSRWGRASHHEANRRRAAIRRPAIV